MSFSSFFSFCFVLDTAEENEHELLRIVNFLIRKQPSLPFSGINVFYVG